MTQIVTIKDMKLEVNAKLTSDIKKQLEKILQDEFSNQRTKYQYEINSQREQILNDYRKKVGFSAKVKRINHLEAELKVAQSALSDTGLSQSGDISYHTPTPEAKALKNELDKLSEACNPLNSVRNKLIARLYMSTTMGEAAVILHEVMGNGQLPAITKAQLENKG